MQNNLITSLIFIFLFIFFNNTLTGQRRGLVYRQANAFDIIIGGDFGATLISGEETLPEVAEVLDRRNTAEDFRLSKRFGINYYHGISGRLALKTGFRFANPGFSISAVEEFNAEQDINTIDKISKTNGFNYAYKYQMFEVPLGLKLSLGGGACNPYVEFGISTHFYRQTAIEKTLYKAEGNELISNSSFLLDEPLSEVNYFGFISSGGAFSIAGNVQGFSQLVLRYQLNNLRPESLITEKMINIGLELGIRYVFKH